MPRSKQGRNQRRDLEKFLAILAYLSVLCIIPLIFQKDNTFVLAHGKQGLVIFVAQVGVFVCHILFGTWVLHLGLVALSALSVCGIAAALCGHYVAFPVFSGIADKITL